MKKLIKGEMTTLIEALTHEDLEMQGEFGLEEILERVFQPREGKIQILVVVPNPVIPHNLQDIGGNCIGIDERFADKLCSFFQDRKRKLDKDGPDQTMRYFKMDGFSPLAHLMPEYNKIKERDA